MKSTPDYMHTDRHTLAGHTIFMAFAMLTLLAMFTLCRFGLYRYNIDLASTIPASEVLTSFFTGVRFDLMVVCILSLPLLAGCFFPSSIRLRKYRVLWLGRAPSAALCFFIAELDF